jgi:hypothetical protein
VLKFAADSPQGVNHKFFEWQIAGGWKNLHRIKETALLQTIFQESVDEFLTMLGVDSQIIAKRSRDIGPWATIAKLGLFHLRHGHPNNIVSGVYYVKVSEFLNIAERLIRRCLGSSRIRFNHV